MSEVEAWPNDKVVSEAVTLVAKDAYLLAAQYWYPAGESSAGRGVVVINPATAVKASYYHRYAHFLAAHGFRVLTYDYRGIGASRYGNLRAFKPITRVDWGRLDCEAALSWAAKRCESQALSVVAHSIGGMALGLAASNRHVARCLMVGAQFAYWPDYARASRTSMWLRWHLLMPVLTTAYGYFPAKALGWHEDLPSGVAYEWAFGGKRLGPVRGVAAEVLRNFDAMTGQVLSVDISDDPFGTPAAVDRLLSYFTSARRYRLSLSPVSVGVEQIGHFAYFHDRFRDSLWRESLNWLMDGSMPQRSIVPFALA